MPVSLYRTFVRLRSGLNQVRMTVENGGMMGVSMGVDKERFGMNVGAAAEKEGEKIVCRYRPTAQFKKRLQSHTNFIG